MPDDINDALHLHKQDIAQFALLTPEEVQHLGKLMELRRALLPREPARSEARDLILHDPMTDPAIRAQLERAMTDTDYAQGLLDGELQEAWNQFITANLKLAVALAQRYKASKAGPTISLEDLVAEAEGGIMEAVSRFNWRERNDDGSPIQFSTYAGIWVMQRLSRYAAKTRRAIRIPAHIQNDIQDILSATRVLKQELADEPSYEQIAQYVTFDRLADDPTAKPVTAVWVADTLRYNQPIASLDEPIGEEDMTLADTVADLETVPDNQVAVASLRDAMDVVMRSALTDRERMLMLLRFGALTGTPMNLDDVGREFNLTRERVRQIEERGIEKLQDPQRKRMLEDYLSL